jgi:hypothetical protein
MWFSSLFLLLLSSSPARSEDQALKLGLSFQPRLSATLSGDPERRDQDRITDAGFRVRRMLVLANGTFAHRFDYRLRLNAANMTLDDAQIGVRFHDSLHLSVGQFKVPFTVSQAMGDTSLLLPDRPVVLDGFRYGELRVDGYSWSRDIGAALSGSAAEGRFEYGVGVFNGEGSNVWPPVDEAPLLAGRIQVAPLGAMKLDEVDLGRAEPRLAVGLSGSGLAPTSYDEAGEALGSVQELRAGADVRLLARGLSVQTEALLGIVDGLGFEEAQRSVGAYAQLGYCFPVGLAPGLRWSWLDPSSTAVDDSVTQVEGVLNWYLPDPANEGGNLGHKAQIQLHWATSLKQGLDHPLSHQLQLATALSI